MINKIHSRGTGGGAGPVQYLLGKDGDREGATLLRGDPSITMALIDSSKYAKKYTSGVLSFAEADLPADQKRQIMDSFERSLLPGMDADQYNCLWVEHQDKGRLELNYVIPNLELTSGKRLQPYYDRADRPRMNAWKDMINIRLDLKDPNDPGNRQLLTLASDLPRGSQEASKAITSGLTAMAEQGLVTSRQDIVKALEGAGFTVARETKSSISIANPEGGRNIRLKGALYEQGFRAGPELRGAIEAASSQYREGAAERFREARVVYQRGVEIKREEIRQRYPRAEPADPPARTPGMVVDGPKPVPGPRPGNGKSVLDRPENRRQPGSDSHTEPHTGTAQPEYLGDRSPGEQRGPVYPAPSAPESADWMGRRQVSSHQNQSGVEQGDGAGAGVIQSLRRFTERLRETSERMAERLRRAAEHVRAHIERDSGLTEAGRQLERASIELEQATQKVIQRQELEKARAPSFRGPSM